jgi:hypothetical protein
MGREIGVADKRADPKPALGRSFDLVEAKTIHVDKVCRCFDLELHEIEQIGPPGDELGSGSLRRFGCFERRGSALIGERLHAFLPATSAIASWMFE